MGRYIEEAQAGGVVAEVAVTEQEVRAAGKGAQARPLPSPSQQRQALAGRREQISVWLGGDRPLRLVRVHELLERDEVVVRYTTLRRYVQRELGWRKKQPTVRLKDPEPGQEAQIDFGLMGTIADEEGKPRKLYALIVTLSSSRHMFV